jgi:hypothetical protein
MHGMSFQPPLALVRTFPQYAGPALDEEARAGAEGALRRMATAAVTHRGVPLHTVLHEGEITSGIGRAANRVVREAACPVLTVRGKQPQVRAHLRCGAAG